MIILGADASLAPAIDALRRGELVAFPTETVYGLGALATDPDAVAKVYAAKGRPSDNPLIVHVADGDLSGVVEHVSEAARALIQAFWPGPLTLVARRAPGFPDAVSAGRDTVAVRCPDHPLALELIRGAGPIAAPSANRSGSPSPTRAEHVVADLGEAVAVVVDGGPCAHGLESTIVDVTGERPLVLRPGAIPIEAVEACIGPVEVHPSVDAPDAATDARAPGMRYRHYSPSAEVWLFEGPGDPGLLRTLLRRHPRARALWIGASEGHARVESFPDAEALGHALYARFRSLDAERVPLIFVGGVPAEQLGRTLLNRLRKAASRTVG